jgi:predicted metal-dependent RNase
MTNKLIQESIMQSAIHIKTKVQQGGKILLELPKTTVGEDVDVFIVLPKSANSELLNNVDVLEMIAEIHSHRPPASTEALDNYLQAERDSWDS